MPYAGSIWKRAEDYLARTFSMPLACWHGCIKTFHVQHADISCTNQNRSAWCDYTPSCFRWLMTIKLAIYYVSGFANKYTVHTLSLFCVTYSLLIICSLKNEVASLSGTLLNGLLPAGEENDLRDDNGVGEVPHGAGGAFPSPAAPEGSPGTPGWRYVSWLPSFSVEQSHTQLPRHHQPNSQPASTSQLDNLARQVREGFSDLTF